MYPNLPKRSQCACVCHTGTAIHVSPCCVADFDLGAFGAWTASGGVNSKADVIDMAKWAFAMASGEAKAAGRTDFANTFARYSRNASTMYASFPTAKVFGAVVNTIQGMAPQTAARVRQMAYEYSVKYEGWGQKLKSVIAPSAPAMDTSMTATVDVPLTERPWFAPTVVLGGLGIAALLLAGSLK